MANTLFYQRLFWNAPVFGVVGVLFTQPAFAQGVGDIVRGLNAIMNPSDAQRLEDQARRNNRPAEERYWRDYRTGLESHDRTGDTGPRRDYGDHRLIPVTRVLSALSAAINLELGRLSPSAQRALTR